MFLIYGERRKTALITILGAVICEIPPTDMDSYELIMSLNQYLIIHRAIASTHRRQVFLGLMDLERPVEVFLTEI
jgi:hypothetical protein